MENLRKALINKYTERLNKDLEQIKTEEGLNTLLKCYRKNYKKNPTEFLTRFLRAKSLKDLNKEMIHLNAVVTAPEFNGEFIITIEWKNSRMWGENPRAYTNYGFISESVGGCGYCKLSTATARALNSNLSLLKLLFQKKEDLFKELGEVTEEVKRDRIGYGAGYGILPHFEGGVGVSSHQNIIKGLGLVMLSISDTKRTNVYLIRKMTQEEKEQYQKRGY